MKIQIEVRVMETFSFTPEGGSEGEIHILSGLLREYLLANAIPLVQVIQFPDTDTPGELIARHGIEAPRMASMTASEAIEPVIVGELGDGSHILIDGAHRRLFWALRGNHRLLGWIVPEYVWREFTYDPAKLAAIGAFQAETGEFLPQRRNPDKD